MLLRLRVVGAELAHSVDEQQEVRAQRIGEPLLTIGSLLELGERGATSRLQRTRPVVDGRAQLGQHASDRGAVGPTRHRTGVGQSPERGQRATEVEGIHLQPLGRFGGDERLDQHAQERGSAGARRPHDGQMRVVTEQPHRERALVLAHRVVQQPDRCSGQAAGARELSQRQPFRQRGQPDPGSSPWSVPTVGGFDEHVQVAESARNRRA